MSKLESRVYKSLYERTYIKGDLTEREKKILKFLKKRHTRRIEKKFKKEFRWGLDITDTAIDAKTLYLEER